MTKSGQQPSKADDGGQRAKPEKPKSDQKTGTGTPASKPLAPSGGAPSGGQSGAKKG